jgi:hypothetical protein
MLAPLEIRLSTVKMKNLNLFRCLEEMVPYHPETCYNMPCRNARLPGTVLHVAFHQAASVQR